jgi:hypothetical protein
VVSRLESGRGPMREALLTQFHADEPSGLPRVSRLAWPGIEKGEMNFPEIWSDPLPIVVDCLRNNQGWEAVKGGLPDVAVIETATEPEAVGYCR